MPERPREIILGDKRLVDVRHLFPPIRDRTRPLSMVTGLAVHHDAVLMPGGDLDFSGSTLDEDLDRLFVIYRYALRKGWSGFPYHAAGSPNGRAFYTRDVNSSAAHVRSQNRSLLGVVLLGNFMQHPPGQGQVCAAGAAIAAFWRELGELLPIDPHKFRPSPGGDTQCPGDTWNQWSSDLYAAVALHASRHA